MYISGLNPSHLFRKDLNQCCLLSKPLFSDFWYTLAKSKCLYLIRSSSLLKTMFAGGGDKLIVGDLVDAPRSVIPQGFAVNRRGDKSRAFVDGAPIKATMTTMAMAVVIRRFILDSMVCLLFA